MSPEVPSAGVSRDELERLLGVARRLASSTDLGEVLDLIIDALRDLLDAERASVFQYDAAEDVLLATRAHGLPGSLRLDAGEGLIGEAARTREVISIADAYSDSRFNQQVDRETGFRTRSILTVPMVDFEGELVGVAQVLNKRGGVFDEQDRALARHLADQAGAALKRATLLEARGIKQKLEADLEVARRMQQAALPATTPAMPGYDLAWSFDPAERTGGDGFDVLAPSREPGRPLLFMGDATGHGVGPALSAAQAVSMVRMGHRLGAPIESIVEHLNEQLIGDLPSGRFVTAFVGELDLEAHVIRYVSAGQAPLLIVRGSGESECLGSTGMPLGIDRDYRVDPPGEIRLGAGDVFVLLSDGYYEAPNDRGEELGLEQVAQVVAGALGETSTGIIERLVASIEAHTRGAPASDDRTAIILKRSE